MDIWQSLILGIVQGLTEFLPISSSGHLVLAQHVLGINPPGVTFEVLVHCGTLAAVVVYFRQKLWVLVRGLIDRTQHVAGLPARTYILAVVLGTIPAALLGLLLKDEIEEVFSSPNMAGLFLIVTGILLLTTTLTAKFGRSLTLPKGIGIGIAQAAALLPGISRSGSTITIGMLLRVRPADAAEFSFILSIPAILGATVLSVKDLLESGIATDQLGIYILGAATATIVGYISLYILFRLIRQGRLWWFALYCLPVGVATLLWIA